MQFIVDGPDIPDSLIAHHQEGRVVFFCGAGISCGAGLPLFDGLVRNILDEHGYKGKLNSKNEPKDKSKRLDQILSDIELDAEVQRSGLVKSVWEFLQPNYKLKYSKKIHMALLTLSKIRIEGERRLVTTNFDRIFEDCLKERGEKPESFVAPRPSIPKDHYWNGIVYLHGLLDENYNNESRDNLVLTSGDFGRAYLSERWAARFVTELFKTYVVCFVGYSLNDPVMRYLTDAMLNDERDGIILPDRYIFLGRSAESKEEVDIPGVKPIYYDTKNNHRILRDTLVEWSNYYESQSGSKEQIVQEIAGNNPPILSTRPQQFSPDMRRLLWALKDPKAAHYFSTMNPRPAWEWIKILSEPQFKFEDLVAFGHIAIPNKDLEDSISFSFLEPRIKFEYAGNRRIGETGNYYIPEASVRHFYTWITRHLENPDALIWLIRQIKGSRLNESLRGIIGEALRKNSLKEKLRQGGQRVPASEFPDDPEISEVMLKSWDLLLQDEIDLSDKYMLRREFVNWEMMYKINGLTPSLRRALERLLEPKITDMYIPSSVTGLEPPDINDFADVGEYFFLDFDFVSGNGAKDIKEIAMDDGNSLNDKIYFIELFHTSICKLFKFGDEFYSGSKGFSSWLSQIGIGNLVEGRERYFLSEWHHLGDALNELWHKIENENPERARKFVLVWLESPFVFFHKIALRIMRESAQFDANFVYEILVDPHGEFLYSYDMLPQTTALLEIMAQEFSPEQSDRIQNIMLDYDNEDEEDGQ